MTHLSSTIPPPELAFASILLLITCAAFAVAYAKRLLHPRSVLGPDRVSPSRTAGWPLLVLLLIGTTAWIGTQISLASYKQVQWTRAGHPGTFKLSDFTPADYAFLATIPGLVAILVILLSLSFFPPSQRPRLGFSLPHLPTGLRQGFLSTLLILPLVLLVSLLTEWLYRAIHFQHPAEHDLLRAMKDAPTPLIRYLLITGAVLIAPIIEELLFRGLFQSLLVWAYNNLTLPPSSPSPSSPAPSSSSFILSCPEPVEGHPSSFSSPSFSSPRLAAGRWLSILISSLIFASIHDKWAFPPIFVLALCLGFTYERTGNLYANITVHSLFNAFQTAFFLSQLN